MPGCTVGVEVTRPRKRGRVSAPLHRCRSRNRRLALRSARPERFVRDPTVDGTALPRGGDGRIRVDMRLVAEVMGRQPIPAVTRTTIRHLVVVAQASGRSVALLRHWSPLCFDIRAVADDHGERDVVTLSGATPILTHVVRGCDRVDEDTMALPQRLLNESSENLRHAAVSAGRRSVVDDRSRPPGLEVQADPTCWTRRHLAGALAAVDEVLGTQQVFEMTARCTQTASDQHSRTDVSPKTVRFVAGHGVVGVASVVVGGCHECSRRSDAPAWSSRCWGSHCPCSANSSRRSVARSSTSVPLQSIAG